MADIAAVFHWPPHVMDEMTICEIASWRDKAVDRWKKMNTPPDKGRGRS